MIGRIYKERDSAYKILLKCDVEVDDILKELLKLLKSK